MQVPGIHMDRSQYYPMSLINSPLSRGEKAEIESFFVGEVKVNHWLVGV